MARVLFLYYFLDEKITSLPARISFLVKDSIFFYIIVDLFFGAMSALSFLVFTFFVLVFFYKFLQNFDRRIETIRKIKKETFYVIMLIK